MIKASGLSFGVAFFLSQSALSGTPPTQPASSAPTSGTQATAQSDQLLFAQQKVEWLKSQLGDAAVVDALWAEQKKIEDLANHPGNADAETAGRQRLAGQMKARNINAGLWEDFVNAQRQLKALQATPALSAQPLMPVSRDSKIVPTVSTYRPNADERLERFAQEYDRATDFEVLAMVASIASTVGSVAFATKSPGAAIGIGIGGSVATLIGWLEAVNHQHQAAREIIGTSQAPRRDTGPADPLN